LFTKEEEFIGEGKKRRVMKCKHGRIQECLDIDLISVA
jgi:hypothetical protein